MGDSFAEHYEVSNSLVNLWGTARWIAYFMRAGRCKHSRRHEGDFGNAKHRRFAPARRHGVRLTRPTNSLSLQVIRLSTSPACSIANRSRW